MAKTQRCGLAALGMVLLSSCSESWQLMPAPLAHQYLGGEAFRELSSEDRSPEIRTFYATNRPAADQGEGRYYANGATSELRLGVATVRMGEPGLHWQDVLDLSAAGERTEGVPLDLDSAIELDALPTTRGKRFAAEIERVLRRSRFREITLFVHGAKSSFLRSTVQGAQFHHFMARNTAFISFSWPSTGSFLTYRKDVEYAAATAPAMADLIEFLAENTSARRINILAYSAGAQVVAPALTLLAEEGGNSTTARRKLRIGEVYFAAADVGMGRFVNEYLPAFSPMVDNITITYHARDSVLRIAQLANRGENRLGRPDGGELSPEEIKWLTEQARSGAIDAIDMEYADDERPVDFRAHAHWYMNPWVSSDAILQFLYHAEPEERGLERKPGTQIWYFPKNYPEKLEALIEKGRRERGHAD